MENIMSDKDISLFMMTSGEIIVAEVLDATATTYTTKMPSMLVTDPGSDPAKQQVGLAPYCPYADPDNAIDFFRTAIQSIVVPTKQLKEEYERIWGNPSSLVLPEKKLIV
jgi:hypothetical protein